jgi:hypothetical protein
MGLRLREAYPHRAVAVFAYEALKDTHTEHPRLSKSHHGPKLWTFQNIFAGLLLFEFSKYGHILGKTLCSGPRRQPGRQGHGGQP